MDTGHIIPKTSLVKIQSVAPSIWLLRQMSTGQMLHEQLFPGQL